MLDLTSTTEMFVVGIIRLYGEAFPPSAASVYWIQHHSMSMNFLQINSGHQRQREQFCERHCDILYFQWRKQNINGIIMAI
ncbi:hypothetical protein X777_07773 [Ooceraea biroi]|uniref:Uncharacterized protein n=1 Tax=Ooceraea biroi TaxID=2015173 RepID=A0A026WZE4_OOCBI|nr:hypothetical protein X777_07773 [Ooceraea biroi]